MSLGDSAYSSVLRYRYDIGGNVETISVPRSGTAPDMKTVHTYWDTTGKLKRNAIWINVSGAWTEHNYTRYEYPTNGQLKVYSTIIDVNNSNGPDTADEVVTESWANGNGQTFISRTLIHLTPMELQQRGLTLILIMTFWVVP